MIGRRYGMMDGRIERRKRYGDEAWKANTKVYFGLKVTGMCNKQAGI